ncbi:hypothetical protein BH23CHL6_BH23CHL6_00410 [soil metagenome]
MTEIRSLRIDELDAFAATGVDDGSEFAAKLRSMLEDGTTRPEWCFLALIDGRPIARACFALDEPPAAAPIEMYLFGLALDWQRAGAAEAAKALLEQALPDMSAVGPPIDVRVNPEVHPDSESRRRLLESAGLGLFQEKAGYVWQAGIAGIARSDRLRFRSLEAVGRDEFIAVMARGPAGTLDRNDRWYYELTGPVGWATVMMGSLQPGDEPSWQLAYDSAAEAVGYVMLSAFDEGVTGTIAHVGVVPEHRGRGYIDDILMETNASGEARGFKSILSDVDVLNLPMRDAMERAGHMPGRRAWHVWHYRYPPP